MAEIVELTTNHTNVQRKHFLNSFHEFRIMEKMQRLFDEYKSQISNMNGVISEPDATALSLNIRNNLAFTANPLWEIMPNTTASTQHTSFKALLDNFKTEALKRTNGAEASEGKSYLEVMKESNKVFKDSFSQGDNLELTSITPDLGTNYTFLFQNNGGNLGVFTGGLCKVFEPDEEQGCLIECNATYTNDHAIELEIVTVGTCILYVRGTDNDNSYALKVDGTDSQLFVNEFGWAAENPKGSGIVAGDIIRLQIVGNDLTYWKNDIQELIKVKTNHLTGKAGIGMGNVMTSNENMNAVYKNVRAWDVS